MKNSVKIIYRVNENGVLLGTFQEYPTIKAEGANIDELANNLLSILTAQLQYELNALISKTVTVETLDITKQFEENKKLSEKEKEEETSDNNNS